MTKDQAVALARDYVRSNYPAVPPIADVMHVTDGARGHRFRRVLHVERWFQLPGSPGLHHAEATVESPDPDCWACRGKWIVAFGVPERLELELAVDEVDRSVSRVV
jgi:hypothetical protein